MNSQRNRNPLNGYRSLPRSIELTIGLLVDDFNDGNLTYERLLASFPGFLVWFHPSLVITQIPSIYGWIEENCKGGSGYRCDHFIFETKEDAALFKLFWCDQASML